MAAEVYRSGANVSSPQMLIWVPRSPLKTKPKIPWWHPRWKPYNLQNLVSHSKPNMKQKLQWFTSLRCWWHIPGCLLSPTSLGSTLSGLGRTNVCTLDSPYWFDATWRISGKKMRKEWDKTPVTHTARVLARHLFIHAQGFKQDLILHGWD